MDRANEILADNISKFRKKSGLSQVELAEKLGLSYQAISKWETAKCAPNISLLPIMAELFECSIDDLFAYVPKVTRETHNVLPGDSVPDGIKLKSSALI